MTANFSKVHNYRRRTQLTSSRRTSSTAREMTSGSNGARRMASVLRMLRCLHFCLGKELMYSFRALCTSQLESMQKLPTDIGPPQLRLRCCRRSGRGYDLSDCRIHYLSYRKTQLCHQRRRGPLSPTPDHPRPHTIREVILLLPETPERAPGPSIYEILLL